MNEFITKEDFYKFLEESKIFDSCDKRVINYVKELEEQNKEMLECLIYFIKRVREGSIRSKKTYAMYIEVVEKITGKSIEQVLNNE